MRILAVLMAIFVSTNISTGEQDIRLKYFETLKISDIKLRTRRSIDPNPKSHLHQVSFHALGRDFHLDLRLSTILSPGFKATIVDKEGKIRKEPIDYSQFFSGKLADDAQSDVTAHWEDDVLMASISTQEDDYVIEPSWRVLPPSSNHSIIAYRKSDMKWDKNPDGTGYRERFCDGADTSIDREENLEEADTIELTGDYSGKRERRDTSALIADHKSCRLYVVADYSFHENIGKRKIHWTASYLISILNKVNTIYKRTKWPDENSALSGLGFEIAELKIHEGYTYGEGDHYNMANRNYNTTRLLQVFSRGTEFQGYCLAHLFTYETFGRGVLGLAYIASHKHNTPGGICSPSFTVDGHLSTLNTGWSTSANSQGNRVLSLEAALVTAHELGHSWGSEYDVSLRCSPKHDDGGHYLMYPYSVTGYEANNKYFSPCSRRYIYIVLKSKVKDCFTAERKSFSFCGNGRVDEDEECDAGTFGDQCCNKECKLVDDAVCSPWNFACCHSNCKVAPVGTVCHDMPDDTVSCKGTAYCDGINMTCPRPKDKADNSSCVDEGRCFNGACVGYCELRGKVACICPQESACYRCCKKPNDTNSVCEMEPEMHKLPDGRPCYRGYCVNGVCEKQIADVIQRLFRLIENITADELVAFMRSNIVGTIIVFSLMLWIPASCTFSYFDKKKERRYYREAQGYTNQGYFDRSRSLHTLNEEDKNRVWHYGSFKLRNAGSVVRKQNLLTGYADLERESKV
ncbi:ADAM 17-like protease [Mizuhopecten yessoensis]|uniref:ADAM 17-like protease n=1 Tax=Mizuhopecten yessoensis TaxID=6573 RepID=A0A210Q788_MIZYE|nr:ADAM 17-like protease [Mizuhopecten yessoensis]OWF44607.1 ADAM 17-like protease [Mizuhopecten yessoensis]